MSSDLEQFYEVFFEESSELLAEMEACLLGLDVNSPDMEDMNAIFRAAHSIKGGAGTFGFTDMTEMTHMLETLLDKLRKGELEVRSEMIDAFLKAGDVIKDQLAGHRGDGEADPAAAAAVCEELSKFSEETFVSAGTAEVPVAAVEESTESAPTVAELTEENAPVTTTEKTVFLIEFPNAGLNEKTRGNILYNLGEMGQLEKLVFSESEPSSKLRLVTDSTEEDVWEMLVFVVDPTNLKIETEALTEDSANEQLSVDESVVDAGESESEEPYGFFPEAPTAPADAKDDEVKPKGSKEGSKVSVINKNTPSTKASANSAETSSIRVSIEKVDQMINLVGELVITQAMLAQTASEIDPVIFEKLLSGMSQLERNTRDLQESVMSIRMLPISFVFSRFPRLVRDLASKLNKQIELKQVGEGTELDKGLIEKIADPLTHLIRNSLDHGVEMPDDIWEFLADNIKTNIRELEGAIISLIAHSSFNRKEITIDLARKIVDNYVKHTKREVSIDYIQKVVSDYFQMDVDTLQSKTRKRHIVQARQLAMFFAKKFTKASLASIGSQIGQRDHATVLHACKTVDNLSTTDKQFRKYVEDLNKKLTL